MKIFVPALKDANSFFDEISFHSKHNFVYGSYTEYKDSYEIVLIHWPEQLFGWKEPTLFELENFEKSIKIWKKNSKIIHVIHNLKRHYGMTPNFEKIYSIVQENCDVMVHFGEFSFNLFSKKYPKKLHKIIKHPLYEKTFKVYDKNFAREKLNINKNTLIVIAPGAIRNNEEKELVLNAFKSVKVKNKILIVPRMIKRDFNFEFRGRMFLKKIIDIKKYYEEFIAETIVNSKKYLISFKYLSDEELSIMMSTSDIVLLPRIKLLNSGNFYLGLTFNKIIVGPKTGNIEEDLKYFGFPLFDPKNPESISEAINKGVSLLKNKDEHTTIELLTKYKPKVIAKKWDTLFNSLLKDTIP